MSTIGLVLGGGGITGAAFHFGTLLAIEMATGWNADDAEVLIGTSSGAFVGALARGNALHLDTFAAQARLAKKSTHGSTVTFTDAPHPVERSDGSEEDSFRRFVDPASTSRLQAPGCTAQTASRSA
ncbi:MAG: hypothetical protein V3S38_05895 [Acidimicrobiia bacterium]